jgi:hypothetical protein
VLNEGRGFNGLDSRVKGGIHRMNAFVSNRGLLEKRLTTHTDQSTAVTFKTPS